MLIAQVRLHEDNVSRTQAEKSMILKALICQFMGEYKFNLKKCKWKIWVENLSEFYNFDLKIDF